MSDDFIRADMIPKKPKCVERSVSVEYPLDGCPDSIIDDNLKVCRYCRLQPLRYQKLGDEYVTRYQLCFPKCFRDNWQDCILRQVQQGGVALTDSKL